jgi:hypothetical protein
MLQFRKRHVTKRNGAVWFRLTEYQLRNWSVIVSLNGHSIISKRARQFPVRNFGKMVEHSFSGTSAKTFLHEKPNFHKTFDAQCSRHALTRQSAHRLSANLFFIILATLIFQLQVSAVRSTPNCCYLLSRIEVTISGSKDGLRLSPFTIPIRFAFSSIHRPLYILVREVTHHTIIFWRIGSPMYISRRTPTVFMKYYFHRV